jgi:hypothetical protein
MKKLFVLLSTLCFALSFIATTSFAAEKKAPAPAAKVADAKTAKVADSKAKPAKKAQKAKPAKKTS